MGKAESAVEDYLNERCAALGWTTRKFVSPGRSKVADRLVIPDHRAMFFVECKAPGVDIEATPHGRAQVREHERMRKLGQRVYVVDSRREVDAVLQMEQVTGPVVNR